MLKGYYPPTLSRGGAPNIIFLPPDILPNAAISQSRHDFLPPCMLFPLPPKIGLGGGKMFDGGRGVEKIASIYHPPRFFFLDVCIYSRADTGAGK